MADRDTNKGGEIPKIRTFKTDAEIFMRERNISELDISRSAYLAKTAAPSQFGGKKWSYKTLALVLAITILAAGAGYWAWNSIIGKAPTGPILQTSKPPAPLLLADGVKPITVSQASPGSLIEALKEEVTKDLRIGTVLYLPISVLTRGGETKYASAHDISTLLNWKAPGDFLENLLSEQNVFAVYNKDSRDVAFLFKIKNFERALSSLFQWERTIWLDFKPFLKEQDIDAIGKFKFTDEIIKNHDARTLQKDGGVILGYAIFNRQLVIISTSRESLSAILDRLITLPPR